ncbi:MAG: DUF3857 domain-containing protein [Ferruginibacter sp.]
MLFISGSLFSGSPRPSVSKEPAWISKKNIDYNKTTLDKDATDGYIDISFEVQVSLADQSEYFRSSKKIISQAGVQNGSEISVSFDPSHEQLIFHTIRIIRNGETINKLRLSDIKTVHQEDELAAFIYNGSLNAVLILEDVRQGDIIEYSYTRKGFNPIFKNKYTREFGMEFSFPLYEIYYKLIVPGGRKMNIKNLNQTLQPVITSVNDQQIFEWQKKDIAPFPMQDYAPSWYDPYAKILVSEYNSWKEVNDWAMELFPAKKTLSAGLQKKIKEIEKAYIRDDERTKAALRFVQDDIRYMGFEMGENSHRPADPSKVFAQRFGDCKEKSYLLCCMLNAMNIDASPVLINTVSKKNINTLLPSPTDFDHVTVRVKLNNIYYWYDPTIAYQRGGINNLFYPDYQAGLVISDGTSSLTPIVFRNISDQHIKEYFKVPSMVGRGSLTVTTTYRGNDADGARNSIYNSSITELMTNCQKFYAAYYEDIKADSLTYLDNDSTGIFKITEYYTIPNFWKINKGKVKNFSFSSFIINSILRRPKEKDRKMPFGLLFPAKYREEIIVDLPDDWKVTESEDHLKNKCYSYNSKFYGIFNHVHLETDYENYKDHSTIDESPAYFKDLGEYDDIGSFELTSGTDDRNNSSGKNILYAIIFIGAVIASIVWRIRRK